MHVSTRLIHADEAHAADRAARARGSRSVERDRRGVRDHGDDAPAPGFYNRHGNANHEQAAAILAELEGAERGLLTSAGMGAATTAILTLLKAGDHVIGQRSVYAGVTSWMLNLLPRFGVETTIVDQTDLTAFEDAYRPNTTLVLLETPRNPRLEITDLKAVAAQAKHHDVLHALAP